MNKKLIISGLILSLTLCLSSCNNHNRTKNTVSMDTIGSAITAQMKTDFLESGASTETDFEDGTPPGYEIKKLKETNFRLPIEYDKNAIEDAVAITHRMNGNADMIVVMKAHDNASISKLETYVKKLKEEQVRMCGLNAPDQLSKVQKNITKTIGKYVLYITYDKPDKIESAIMSVMK